MGEQLGGNFEGGYERVRQAGPLEARLNEMALERGHEREVATSERSAEWILFQRMMYLLVEESLEWDPQQRANLRKTVAAFGAIAFPRFKEREQSTFVDHFMGFYEDEGRIKLDRTQAGMVSRLGSRVDIPFDMEPTTLTFTRPEIPQFKRITEIEDPTVTAFLAKAPEDDRVGYILTNISSLSLRQKVQLLLTLSDEEYEAFKTRRKAGFADIAADILANPDLIADPQERFTALSHLRAATPRYEAEAEIRRHWNGEYPAQWDQELEEDQRFKPNDSLPRWRNGKKISYEEAVEFARFEYARKFYRLNYFPSVSRGKNPLPITIDTLFNEFQTYLKRLAATGKPGTNITTKDLLNVITYYLGYEPDNEENCAIHREVQSLAELINTVEEALEKK